MALQTVKLSSFEAYLANGGDTAEVQAEEETERRRILERFPFPVVLELAFPELDFANRWCWQQFGPGYGECFQHQSMYRVCAIDSPHCHIGSWTNHWLAKTDYDFGFNEWYFLSAADRDLFLQFVPSINWGECFPK